jgi:hypothetical protein
MTKMREIIKKILKEETSKDLTESIKKLIKLSIGKEYENVICSIKVIHPKDRKVLKFQTEPYTHYRIDIIFKGDTSDYYNSTQISYFEDISDKIEKTIIAFMGIDVAIFYRILQEC